MLRCRSEAISVKRLTVSFSMAGGLCDRCRQMFARAECNECFAWHSSTPCSGNHSSLNIDK